MSLEYTIKSTQRNVKNVYAQFKMWIRLLLLLQQNLFHNVKNEPNGAFIYIDAILFTLMENGWVAIISQI